MTDSPHTYACIFYFQYKFPLIFIFLFLSLFFFSPPLEITTKYARIYTGFVSKPNFPCTSRHYRVAGRVVGGGGGLICVAESVLYGRIRPWTTEYCSIQTIHESRGFEWATVHRDFDRVSFDHQSCCSLIAARFQNCSHAARFALCHVGQQLFNPHRGCNGKRYKLLVVVVVVVVIKGAYKMQKIIDFGVQ